MTPIVRILLTGQSGFMSARRTITVSITPEQDALIRACLHSGHFATVSEVVRAGLRLLQRNEAAELGALQAVVGDPTMAGKRDAP